MNSSAEQISDTFRAVPSDIEPVPPPPPTEHHVHYLPPLATFSPTTEKLLGVYFCRGGSLASPSNFGAMLERADRVQHASVACPACDGTGFDHPTGKDCKRCRGTAFTTPRKIARGKGDTMWTTVRCAKCMGVTSLAPSDKCTRCEDSCGYVSPITVRETGSSMQQGVREPDVAMIAQHGQLDRIVQKMRATDDVAAQALELYYGPVGNRWGNTEVEAKDGHSSAPGRIFSLWPVTKPGNTLARESREKSESQHTLSLTAHDLLFEEREQEKRASEPNIRRRAMLDQADKAARHLYDRAQRAWVKAVREVASDPADSSRIWHAEVTLQMWLDRFIEETSETSAAWGEALNRHGFGALEIETKGDNESESP